MDYATITDEDLIYLNNNLDVVATMYLSIGPKWWIATHYKHSTLQPDEFAITRIIRDDGIIRHILGGYADQPTPNSAVVELIDANGEAIASANWRALLAYIDEYHYNLIPMFK